MTRTQVDALHRAQRNVEIACRALSLAEMTLKIACVRDGLARVLPDSAHVLDQICESDRLARQAGALLEELTD